MELLELTELLTRTPDELIKAVQATKRESKSKEKIDTYLKQYDPKNHAITDKTKRPDKTIETDSGTSVVDVTRIPIAFQKQIVALAAAFLCGNPIALVANPETTEETDFLKVLRRHWADNKLDYESKAIAKIMMSETEAAELWYVQAVEPQYWKGTAYEGAARLRLRMKLLANKFGDTLYPVFDSAGDMIAFAREYTIDNGGKKEEHFDIYTDAKKYLLTKGDQGWAMVQEVNTTGKIPVIYYDQENPEWSDVQELIERAELFLSNHSDTNDYNGSPLLFVEGKINGFASKGERGKVLQGESGAKVNYVSWTQSIESLKLEWEILRSLIFDLTSTPDISIEQMKSLGTYSGTALKMLFLGAHLKAADKEEFFGKSIQRRINFMKEALGKFNTKYAEASQINVCPKFEYYLPKNYQEIIETLSTATGGKPTMSQRTAVRMNPFVSDTETEIEEISKEGLDAENANL